MSWLIVAYTKWCVWKDDDDEEEEDVTMQHQETL
jgi:hypothetical protein